MNRTTAAIVGAALLAAVAAFQTALAALGAPFGDAVLGGRAPTDDSVLPTGYRVAAALQALVLLGLGTVLLAGVGVVRAPAAPTGSSPWPFGRWRCSWLSTRWATSHRTTRSSDGCWVR